jgi:hypothetical protein
MGNIYFYLCQNNCRLFYFFSSAIIKQRHIMKRCCRYVTDKSLFGKNKRDIRNLFIFNIHKNKMYTFLRGFRFAYSFIKRLPISLILIAQSFFLLHIVIDLGNIINKRTKYHCCYQSFIFLNKKSLLCNKLIPCSSKNLTRSLSINYLN